MCGGICGGNPLGIAGLDVFPSPAVPLWISRNPSLSVPGLTPHSDLINTEAPMPEWFRGFFD